MDSPSLRSPRVAWAFTLLGGAVAAWLTRTLPPAMLLDGAPLAPLCGAVALAGAVGAALPRGAARAEAVLRVALASLRLAIPLLLTLAWRGDGRELWAAVVVFVAVHDAWHAPAARAPLAPVALAMAFVIGWSSTTREVAPARAVLIALVAGVAAAWGHDRGRVKAS